MASRTAQKQAAREKRLAEERAAALKARRTRRMQMVGGVIAAAIVVVVVLVVVSSGGGSKTVKANTPAARSTANTVTKMLSGIPQSGVTLGKSSAPVTLTEYGDLQCPVCADFAKGGEAQLIAKDVRAGKVKLVYKSFETATQGSPTSNMWVNQQSAAYAAGEQGKAWNFIQTLYREQGQEGTSYMTTSFLQNIAKSVPGLDYAKWNRDRFNPAFEGRVTKESSAAQSLNFQDPQNAGTPALIAAGPKSQTKAIVGALSYGELQSMIKSVQ